MKRFIFACVTLAGVFSLVPLVIDAQQPPAAQRPELAILYTIDGFSDKRTLRVHTDNLDQLFQA